MQDYKKRLSKGEIEKHAVLVLKSALKFFPDFDSPFFISVNCYGKLEEFETVLERAYCECRGTPHYHYYIDLLAIWQCFTFNVGDYIIIKKNNDKFILEIV